MPYLTNTIIPLALCDPNDSCRKVQLRATHMMDPKNATRGGISLVNLSESRACFRAKSVSEGAFLNGKVLKSSCSTHGWPKDHIPRWSLVADVIPVTGLLILPQLPFPNVRKPGESD